MTFDKILDDGRLWAVQYEDCPTNALQMVFDQEREHTLKELYRMEKVRQYLLSENVIDADGFNEMINEQ